jgi:hypothetical protein
MRKSALTKFQFQYASWKGATVTVYAASRESALTKARQEMDRRYAKQDREPPVAWTLVDMDDIGWSNTEDTQ